jgi:ferredoxin
VKVTIDQEKCVGAGSCVMVADAVFDQRDEDGVVVLLEAEPSAEWAGDVREAAAVCPAQAITVQE